MKTVFAHCMDEYRTVQDPVNFRSAEDLCFAQASSSAGRNGIEVLNACTSGTA